MEKTKRFLKIVHSNLKGQEWGGGGGTCIKYLYILNGVSLSEKPRLTFYHLYFMENTKSSDILYFSHYLKSHEKKQTNTLFILTIYIFCSPIKLHSRLQKTSKHILESHCIVRRVPPFNEHTQCCLL